MNEGAKRNDEENEKFFFSYLYVGFRNCLRSWGNIQTSNGSVSQMQMPDDAPENLLSSTTRRTTIPHSVSFPRSSLNYPHPSSFSPRLLWSRTETKIYQLPLMVPCEERYLRERQRNNIITIPTVSYLLIYLPFSVINQMSSQVYCIKRTNNYLSKWNPQVKMNENRVAPPHVCFQWCLSQSHSFFSVFAGFYGSSVIYFF